MDDLPFSAPSAPALLDPRVAAEGLGVLSQAMPSAPLARTIAPLLLAVHYANSALDRLYYDTDQFWLKLCDRALSMSSHVAGQAGAAGRRVATYQAAAEVVLKDLFSPEGAILVVDAQRPPFVSQHGDVESFLAGGLKFPNAADAAALNVAPADVEAIAVTGVGSSALGSAAFAWNVSEALHKPVAALAPGFGLADAVPQALVGWLGFGVLDAFRRTTERTLQDVAPELAKIGRRLSLTASPLTPPPDPFPRDAPESEVLHAVLEAAPQIRRLFGHSKGAFPIRNALRRLPPERIADLHVTTFGCVIAEETRAESRQILGTLDGLGRLNSWGAFPEQWVNAWRSTNTLLPMTMHVAELLGRGAESSGGKDGRSAR